jgi:hypothetical protein
MVRQAALCWLGKYGELSLPSQLLYVDLAGIDVTVELVHV